MRTILTKEIQEDITINKVECTSYMCIDLFVNINGIEGYTGSINNIDNAILNTQGTMKVTINGFDIGSILHNVQEVKIKRYSKDMTTLQVHTRIL